MSTKRKRAVLSIKDKQIIISRLDKGEKGTNLAQEFGISIFLINIHIFDYPDSRLSGLFTEVPTSPDNRGSTVIINLIYIVQFLCSWCFTKTYV